MTSHKGIKLKQIVGLPKHRQEDRAKAEALFNSLGEGVFSTNDKGCVERINDVALELLGFKRDDLVGKWYPGTVEALRADGTKISRLDRPISRAFLTGKPVIDKVYYRRKDGTTFPANVSVAPIMLDSKPIGAIEIFRDISLEEQVDRIKTDFISLASHQLRTPLSAISTYSHMLAEGYAGKLNNDQAIFINTIIEASDRMNDLINILLNVTRIEAGTITVKISPTNLINLTRELAKQFGREAANKQITISVTDNLPQPKVMTDSLLVREVLSNLLSNAIKYTRRGGKIKIELKDEPNRLVFSVEDNGFGIPEEVQKMVFSKFFRAHNIIKRDVGGTGLGLYLTKILVENLDGEIWFNSQQNRGSTFYFSLPKKGSKSKIGKFSLESR